MRPYTHRLSVSTAKKGVSVKKEEIFLGVDPGINGSIACLDSAGKILLVEDLPHISNTGKKKDLHLPAIVKIIKSVVEDAGQVYAAIEKVTARPGQGVVSMFRFGRASGQVEGILLGLGIPVMLVSPKTWAKLFHPFVDGQDSKAKSVLAASMRWPEVNLPLKKDHGKAEALLIAEFCRKYNRGTTNEEPSAILHQQTA